MPPSPRLPHVVVDTNLFVSGIILKRGFPYELLALWRNGGYVLLMSDSQYLEIEDLLARPMIVGKYGVSANERTGFLQLIQTAATRVEPAPALPLEIRDPKDIVILASALGGNADFLVTGDDDLLALAGDARLGHLQIITARAFLGWLSRISSEAL
jgi:putative PIN family toxin of toxin-antitoxin system